jgi:Cu2+-exporting ATPase
MTDRLCLHCLQKLQPEQINFCCLGCKAAYKIIKKNGFSSFYSARKTSENFNQSSNKSPSKNSNGKYRDNSNNRPETLADFSLNDFAKLEEDGCYDLSVMIFGLHCAACIWLIENLMQRQKSVVLGRVNLSQKTLHLRWKSTLGDLEEGKRLLKLINSIGYKILPFDAKKIDQESKKEETKLTKALAVAGFGAGNIMLFSFSLWFANKSQMGEATRQFLHFFSSLLALPVIIFSGRIFFVSAFKSLKSGFANMDLAISIAILLASAVSLAESFSGGQYVYFDSAVMLVFFLLIGRFLDFKARKKAFDIVSEFTLLSASFGRVEQEGKIIILPAEKLIPGMILLVAVGEKIAADGEVIEGESSIDNSLLTGESLPKKILPKSQVFAGTINLSSPIKLRITSFHKHSFLSQASRLIASIEEKKSRYLRIADRWSKIYTPAVHSLALLTFLSWFFLLKSGFETALMNATAVLVITCPCALALAVPIVQTIAVGMMIKRGILVKNGEIFEKLPKVKTIIFDKTGTLTQGSPKIVEVLKLGSQGAEKLEKTKKNQAILLAAKLAKHSRHPLSLAISAAAFEVEKELPSKDWQSLNFGIYQSPLKLEQNPALVYQGTPQCGDAEHSARKNYTGNPKDSGINSFRQTVGVQTFVESPDTPNQDFEQILEEVEENQGFGLKAKIGKDEIFLGRRDFCKIDSESLEDKKTSEKTLGLFSSDRQNQTSSLSSYLRCFFKFGETQLVFFFYDCLKEDGLSVVKQLQNSGKRLILLSGDDKNVVEAIARTLGIREFYGEVDLASKAEFVKNFKSTMTKDEKLLMVGDGLNDAPSLALADVSISFGAASDLAQNIADIVISNNNLAPIVEAIDLASYNLGLMKQNLVISLVYNLIAVPFAMTGNVVPLVAAIAMSSSSLLVLFNSLRARKGTS